MKYIHGKKANEAYVYPTPQLTNFLYLSLVTIRLSYFIISCCLFIILANHMDPDHVTSIKTADPDLQEFSKTAAVKPNKSHQK